MNDPFGCCTAARVMNPAAKHFLTGEKISVCSVGSEEEENKEEEEEVVEEVEVVEAVVEAVAVVAAVEVELEVGLMERADSVGHPRLFQ